MKNIYLLPTKEPSRLQYGMFNNSELGLSKEPLSWRDSRHLYITSDDEIKEGDWFYDNHFEQICMFDVDFKRNPNDYDDCKKIILTTDPKLISDGIQVVDEDFLKWFLIHSHYEFVEVGQYAEDDGYETDANGRAMSKCKWVWRITIPTVKNEPIDISNLEERFKKDANMIVMPLSKSYLQGFIDQFGTGEFGELDSEEWNALGFLQWLKLNNYDIVKKK